jgi:hypothetical protein
LQFHNHKLIVIAKGDVMTNYSQELFNIGRAAAFLSEEARKSVDEEYSFELNEVGDTLVQIADVALGHFRPDESHFDPEYPGKYERLVDELLEGVDTGTGPFGSTQGQASSSV